jgi:FkbM family methyltransferase
MEYCIEDVPIYDNGWVIDIGANVGEFSMYLERKAENIKFICFEPSVKEAECCELNLAGNTMWVNKYCLWETQTQLDFYHANETGDSSIFPTRTNLYRSKVFAYPLDMALLKHDIEKIMILKLEAEGAEPEILRGGLETLKITEYVSADLGPERGTEHLRTFDECNRILEESNFRLIRKYNGNRETYLYKNLLLNRV